MADAMAEKQRARRCGKRTVAMTCDSQHGAATGGCAALSRRPAAPRQRCIGIRQNAGPAGAGLRHACIPGLAATLRTPERRHAPHRAARLALASAKPAPRGTRCAPLATNASHLNVHNTL
ncbi:hypothetical protein CIW71_01765 [Xanthomonas citri pv. malvacearum]|nr:hypothetical protein CIW71_01765 [Xanthomonas citri pv. malvacearum]